MSLIDFYCTLQIVFYLLRRRLRTEFLFTNLAFPTNFVPLLKVLFVPGRALTFGATILLMIVKMAKL